MKDKDHKLGDIRRASAEARAKWISEHEECERFSVHVERWKDESAELKDKLRENEKKRLSQISTISELEQKLEEHNDEARRLSQLINDIEAEKEDEIEKLENENAKHIKKIRAKNQDIALLKEAVNTFRDDIKIKRAILHIMRRKYKHWKRRLMQQRINWMTEKLKLTN